MMWLLRDNIIMISIPNSNPITKLNRLLKIALDYAVTVPSLLFIAPLMTLVALLVRLDSPGPVFYRYQVCGRNGRLFYAWKFRTMYINGDEILAQYPWLERELRQNHKLKEDPRVTPIGAILRKYSLDELPKLFNVLAQEMSLIGPRYVTPEELEKYGAFGSTLLSVTPGLTGLWQVNGRSDTSYEERIQFDLLYIHNWSVWLDIKIMLMTIPAVLKAEGAY